LEHIRNTPVILKTKGEVADPIVFLWNKQNRGPTRYSFRDKKFEVLEV